MNHKGFTLVELAISLTIIGVLIGGVVKGKDILEGARVTSFLSQIDRYEQAVANFEDVYQGIPGDYVQANENVPGCTARGNNTCVNGNGDRLIYSDSGGGSWLFSTAKYNENIPESVQFWKHLAAAGMIDGVYVKQPIDEYEWGLSHPKSPFGGGIEIFYDEATAMGRAFHVLRLSRAPVGASQFDPQGQRIMQPQLAARVDRKGDDGRPFTGRMFVNYIKATDDPCADVSTNEYTINNSNYDCVFFYEFKFK